MKSWRQSQILDVIDRVPVASQEDLRQQLDHYLAHPDEARDIEEDARSAH